MGASLSALLIVLWEPETNLSLDLIFYIFTVPASWSSDGEGAVHGPLIVVLHQAGGERVGPGLHHGAQ